MMLQSSFGGKCLPAASKPALTPIRSPRTAICVQAVTRPQQQGLSAAAPAAAVAAASVWVSPALALVEGDPALDATPAAAAAAAATPADSSVDVDNAVGTIIDVVKAAGQAVKGGINTVQSGVQVLKENYEVVEPVLQQGIRTVGPVVSSAVDSVKTAAEPALRQAAPLVQDAANSTVDSVKQTLQSSGVDLASVKSTADVVVDKAVDAATALSPAVTKAAQFLTSTDPSTLGQYVVGGAAALFLGPPLIKLFFFRNSVSSVTATAALNAVLTENDVVLIDVRSDKDKDSSGVPDVPSTAAARVVEVEFATLADKKLRGLLRDPSDLEAQITAEQIAALKRVSRGSKIIIIDKNGSSARSVANKLASKGYGKVQAVDGGFDGRNGWVQSKLQIKPYTSSSSSGFSLPNLTRIGTRTTKQLAAPRA